MKARCASTYTIIFVDILLIRGTFGQGDCGSQFNLPSDTIQSPNYPGPYPANSDCTWIVAVRGSIKNIRISFNSFNLQGKTENGECLDYVSVEEERYCGNSIPSAIEIGESSFQVHFISDDISADGDTGFSLFYTTQFKEQGSDASGFSQATTGIIAAIFCAVVFVGVATLRCIMTGACNLCGSPDGRAGHNRQLVGTDASYGFQADIPPSYSTVMEHPEQYPASSTDNSPRVTVERQGTATDGSSQTPIARRLFTLQSSNSSVSDDDDSNSPPPPPYLDVITSENLNEYNIDHDLNTDPEPNSGNSSLEVVIDDAELGNPASSTELSTPTSTTAPCS